MSITASHTVFILVTLSNCNGNYDYYNCAYGVAAAAAAAAVVV
jgi:hypothetical protein